MSLKTSSHKKLIVRYYEEMWNEWNFSLAERLLAPDMSFRGSLGFEMRGRAEFCDYMQRIRAAFPDFHNTIECLAGDDDLVVARLSYSGTHRGKIFGVRPSGKRIYYAGAAFFRISNAQVSDGWVLGDVLGLLRQLGAKRLPQS